MKKLVMLSAVLALILSFNAEALEISPYVSGKVSYGFQDYEIDEGPSFDDGAFGGSIAVGISGLEILPIRAEFEFSMSSKAEDSVSDDLGDYWDISAKITSYMANFYYDFYNETKFIPYVGFGLGANTVEIKVAGEKDKETDFAWQLGLGSYYKITENLLADLGVKYSQTSFDGGEDGMELDADITTISLGLRYNF